MKKLWMRFVSIALVAIMVIQFIPSIAFAATTYYETKKADVPIWSDCSSSSTKVKTIAKKGTVLKVSSSKTNSSGNLWYRLTDGNWVYSGNVVKHNHVAVMCGTNKTKYEKNSSSKHIKITYYDDMCSCGYVVKQVEVSRTNENHSMSNNKCTKCGYQHVHQAVMCGNPVVTYEQNNSSSHVKVEKVDEKCSCGKVMDTTTTRKNENHTFNSDNKCTKCGYKKPHVHQAVMCGNPVVTYEQNNSSSHVKVEKVDEKCSCGKVMDTITARSNESHSYDSDDKCTKCGYKKPHVHQAVMCGMPIITYEQNNSSSHVKVEEVDEKCSCGKVMDTTTARTNESHSYDSDDKCTKCGYIKTHVHQAVMCGMPVVTYEQNNSSSHVRVEEVDEKCSCGKVMDTTTARTNESHSYDSDDKCTKCGYIKTHVHQAVMCGMPVVTYEQNNSSSHVKIEEVDEKCSCGFVFTTSTNELEEKHSFDSENVCTKCGYIKGHTHKAIMSMNPVITYEQNIEDTHLIVSTVDKKCSCGKIMDTSVSKTEEKHSYNSNDVCTKCNHIKGHVHKAVMCGVSEDVYFKDTHTSHIKVTYHGNNICSCGYIVSEGTVTEKVEDHIYNEFNVCTKCGYLNKKEEDNSFLELDAEQIISEVVLGNYSEDISAAGLVGEILVGEIPYVGTAADIRDLVADIQNGENIGTIIIDAAAIVPFVGLIKYSDEISESHRIVNKVSDTEEGFSSYREFKKKYGKAGEGMEWHHIVEQSQIKKSGFDSELINNTYNIIPLDRATHQKITAIYNRVDPVTGMRYRDTLAGMSFEHQYAEGLKMLEKVGVIVK